ncbi:hypothetical protein AB0D12_17195 [Streptomyces sp. NPDC048479]|uniref:hypothetical protein n=1 Tax=Streptomyces sp. NPDC048479 TaxID=3154725 RepID=UPI0034237731
MAPYDDNRADVPQPDSVGEWDYWYISAGGWEFAVLAGHEDDPRIVREGEDEHRARPRNRCDGGPKGLLDFDADRAPAAEDAARRRHEWQEFAAAYPPSLPLGHFWQKAFLDPAGYPERQALEDFGDQPVIRALRAESELHDRLGDDPVAVYGDDLAAFVELKTADVLPTWALLTLDGRCFEGGTHACRRSLDACLDALPADAMVVRVLYHS